MSSTAPEDFKFSSPAGRELVKKILSSRLPYMPHDYQLEGVCKSLDGIHLLAILPTGGGKTGFYAMYMLVLIALSQDPSLRPPNLRHKIPPDPALILVLPTLDLEHDMVYLLMHRLSIHAKAIFVGS